MPFEFMLVNIGPPPQEDDFAQYILIMGIIIIGAIIYKIIVRDTFSKDFKYWFLGNFLVLNFEVAILVFIYFMRFNIHSKNIPLKILAICVCSFKFVFLCLAVLLVSLYIKLMKQDLSLYYYGSMGLFSIVLIFPCITIINYNCWTEEFATLRAFWEVTPSLVLIPFFILCPILGGGIVDLYRYIKDRYSKTSPYCN